MKDWDAADWLLFFFGLSLPIFFLGMFAMAIVDYLTR